MDPRKAQQAVRFVRKLAKTAESATDLHNAFFGIGGKFGQLFPSQKEREEFRQSPEYREIVRLRAELRQREKAAPQGIPRR